MHFTHAQQLVMKYK